MSTSADMAQRHAVLLAELAGFGMALARDLQQKALAAETLEETAALSLAFHRVSRSVRQTLALEARLERDRVRAGRDDYAWASSTHTARTYGLRQKARRAVERLVWSEHEGPEAERLLTKARDWLDDAVLDDDFADQPLEAVIARLCTDLGLPIPAANDPAPPRRSSA